MQWLYGDQKRKFSIRSHPLDESARRRPRLWRGPSLCVLMQATLLTLRLRPASAWTRSSRSPLQGGQTRMCPIQLDILPRVQIANMQKKEQKYESMEQKQTTMKGVGLPTKGSAAHSDILGRRTEE